MFRLGIDEVGAEDEESKNKRDETTPPKKILQGFPPEKDFGRGEPPSQQGRKEGGGNT